MDAAPAAPTPAAIAEPAGFWRRFLAACIDLIIYMPVYIGMRMLFDLAFGHVGGAGQLSDSMDFASAMSHASDTYRWSFEALFGVIALGSYAWFFSSRWQGSPGMILLRFRVCDVEGRRIGFGRALAWGVTGTFGWLICCAGVLYMQDDITAAHDMLLSCQQQNIDVPDCIPEIEKVIGISFNTFETLIFSALGLMLFMSVIWALSIALPRDKTGFHNLVCGTRFPVGRP